MQTTGCRKNDGQPRDRGAVRVEVAAAATAAERREVQTIAACLRQALSALPDYHVLMSLADWKYSGQFLLLRRHLRVESVRFNLNEEDPCIHHTEGRVIVADFGCFSFLTTYSPNNGWVETSFQRRRKWDEELLKFVQQQKKPLIWMGDANCAPTDADLSHPKIFRSAHQPDPNLSPEDVGQPGCTDAERKRLKDILEAGKLVDVYRQRNPRTTPAPVQDSAYTWRGYSEDRSPSSARAMRLDHAFASEELLPSVVLTLLGCCDNWALLPDADLSHPKIFRSAHQPDPNLSPEDVGQPGCTDAERKRLKDILEAGYVTLTWYSEDRSPSSARAMRLDHAFASEELLPSVVSVEIVGGAFPRRRFFGSDHCPVLLRLSEAALRSRLPTE
ncbi:DNA-(apurinic or apyrimidinic site) lyase, putative [Eimeria praecox]|uniref:DNA-(Apurinic or apyrimidinic site) lyase, putative n=1 Tax=Eimeria praecox TaxID=51316 RepID=U6H4L3_9EIME|nr:DNA-(apurinic or apyrimidinic site) lyase, putative [Eimeria praecox]